MTKNIDIAVTYHKDFLKFKNDYIKPIHAGKEFANFDLGMRGDNTGDNISAKNCHYAELTVLYWLWKNSDADIKGLFHYRRLFDLSWDFDTDTHIAVYDKDECPENILKELNLTNERIEELTDKYDMLIPYVEDFSYNSNLSVSSHYAKEHIKEHLKLALDVIEKDYPEYLETAISTLSSTTNFFTNMFVMKKELFDECCEWLFHILFNVEKEINLYSSDISPYDYQMRWAGFLGERLLGVFINQKIKEGKSYINCPKVFIDTPYTENNIDEFSLKYSATVIYRPQALNNDLKRSIYSAIYQKNCNIEISIITDLMDNDAKKFLKSSYPKFKYYDKADYSSIIKKAKGDYVCFGSSNVFYENNYFCRMCNNFKTNNSQVVISTYKICNENNINYKTYSKIPYTLIKTRSYNADKNSDILMLSPDLFNIIFDKNFLENININSDSMILEFWWEAILKASRISIEKTYLCNYIKPNNYRFNNNDLNNIKSAISNISSIIKSHSENIKLMFDLYKKNLIYQLVCSNLKDILAKNNSGQNIINFIEKDLINKELKLPNKFDYKLDFYNINNKFMLDLLNKTIYPIISDNKADLIIDYINVYWQLQNSLITF